MICTLCPRACAVERTEQSGNGFCKMKGQLRVARAAVHMWEEPIISGTKGSGTVFFSGCTLRCCYCQNREISSGGFGKDISVERLREIFQELINQGVHNINLVTATQFTPWILEAIGDGLSVPVVFNSSGYETAETLRQYEGKVQIYLPDLKYFDKSISKELSMAENYFEVATKAIAEMVRQVGDPVIEDGIMQKGVIIRHLMLPGHLDDTKKIIDYVSNTYGDGQVLFSLMSQYTPQGGAAGNLARHVTKSEYKAATEYMENCGLVSGFLQERTSAKEEYTPPFDLTGV